MKICTPLFALLIALHGNASAQGSLEPCGQDFADGYHTGVNSRIEAAVARKSSLQLTTYPSFEVESGLRLVGPDLYFVEFRTQFWNDSYVVDRKGVSHMDFTKPKTDVRTSHVRLDPAIAARVERIYSKAIAEAKHSDRGGLDGTTFVFSTQQGACGSTWSPAPGSANGRLVELARRLGTHTRLTAPIDLQRSEKTIIRYLDVIEGPLSR